MYVFDATPLIYLAKADALDVVSELRGHLVVSQRVYDEVVVRGLEEGYPDARRVEEVVQNDRFEVVEVEVEKNDLYRRLVENPNLSTADASVLALASNHDATAVRDEAYGRTVADTEDVSTRGTVSLLLSLVTAGKLSANEARDVVDEMVNAGWHCSPDLYAKIVRKLEGLDAE